MHVNPCQASCLGILSSQSCQPQTCSMDFDKAQVEPAKRALQEDTVSGTFRPAACR